MVEKIYQNIIKNTTNKDLLVTLYFYAKFYI